MGGLLTLIGAAGFIGYLIWLVVRVRNWDSKIPPVIGMLLSMVMLLGGLMWVAETETPGERNPASERSEPAESKEDAPVKADLPVKADVPVEADAPLKEEDAPAEEDAIECRTHEIPLFGIEFDCPAAFGTEGKSNVIAEDEVNYSISTGDSAIVFMCSRISSLSRTEELFHLAGKDPAILYEGFESLDLADEIVSWSEMYQTFDLLDSFSSPESYGFSYAAADDSFGELITELGYKYKNYGGFVDDGGIINLVLIISVPEDTDREEFFALCETVTNSIRFSE
nr:hypothetical protein [uncultured Oscillibacter sp.]